MFVVKRQEALVFLLCPFVPLDVRVDTVPPALGTLLPGFARNLAGDFAPFVTIL